MDFFDAITKRATVKRYEKKDVDDKLIGVILYTANYAESAGNLQAWEFIVVKDDEDARSQLYNASLKSDAVKSAPVNIIVCADTKKLSLKYQERGENVYAVQDTASVATIMVLTAQMLGLGANWIRALDEDKVKQIFGIPADIRPVGIVTVGYPAEKSEIIRRQPIENLTWYNFYKKKYNKAYYFQTGPKEEVFKPIVNQLIDKLKKKK